MNMGWELSTRRGVVGRSIVDPGKRDSRNCYNATNKGSTGGWQWAFQILVPVRTSTDEPATLVVVDVRQCRPALLTIPGSYRWPKCLRVLHGSILILIQLPSHLTLG